MGARVSVPETPAMRILTVFDGKTEVLRVEPDKNDLWCMKDREGYEIGSTMASTVATAVMRRLKGMEAAALMFSFDTFAVPLAPETTEKDLVQMMYQASKTVYRRRSPAEAKA